MRTDRYRILLDPAAQPVNAIAFCQANGIDAYKIPSDGGLRIYDHTIRYREHTGAMDWETHRPTIGPWQETPLVSPPHEHGLVAVDVLTVDHIIQRLALALTAHDDAAAIAETLAPIVQQLVYEEAHAMPTG